MVVEEQHKVMSLAAQVEAVGEMVARAAADCTPEQWQTTMLEENRTVGVVFDHIADVFPYVTDWAVTLGMGRDLPPVTRDSVNRHNDERAEKKVGVSKADTLALLRQNTSAAAGQLRSLTDEQLERKAPFKLIGGKEISGLQLVEWFLINHANNHLKEIEEALNNH